MKTSAARLGTAAFWLLVWQGAYLYVAQEIYIVSPVRAFGRLWELARELAFWQAVAGTGLRVLEGFLLGLGIGVVLAVLTKWSALLCQLLRPMLEVIKATPVASFIILVLVWLPTGRVPMFIVLLMVIPVVWANIHAGLEGMDGQLLEMAAVFRFSRWKKLRFIYVPAVMPSLAAACTTGMGFAWKSAIAAEVIAHPALSIGIRIYNARIYLEMADLFAWTIAVILLSVLLEKLTVTLLGALRRRVLSRLGGGAGNGRPA